MAQVMREAQTVDFGTPKAVGSPQDRTSYVNPDFTKHEGSAGRLKTATDVEVSSLNALVGAIGGAMQQKGRAMFQAENEKAWLTGQAAAAAGKSKDEVETNIFTRAWANEGWSDTKARLSLSDADVRTAADMKTLREKDPEQMKEYLTKRRESLLPLMEGMSMEARKAMVGQMLLSDQHAIAKHQTEYSKFVIDQQAAAITTSHTVANAGMNAAKGDPAAYNAATNVAIGNLWANVVQNPNLPAEHKQKLLTQAAHLSLENNNEQLYEKMRDLKDPQGATMLEQLPFDDQIKLAKAYQASQKDTSTMRTSAFMSNLGLYESTLDDADKPGTSWEDHQVIVQQGVQLGVISKEKIGSLAKAWADGNQKRQAAVSSAGAYAAGDVAGQFRLGKTEDESLSDYIKMMQRKGATPADMVSSLANIGQSTGQNSAYGAIGKLMRSSVAMIGQSGDIDPGQLEGVNAILKTLDTVHGKGQLGAKTAFLGSFDDATQARLLTYWDEFRKSGNSQAAAATAATRANDNATLSTSDKAALAGQQSKENAELVASITPKGLLAQAWEKVVPDAFRFKENIATDKLRASKSWFENDERVEEAQARGKVALLQELNDVSRQHPYMSAESRKTMALTKVAGRTLTTDGGPVILPQGQTVQSFFGVEQSISPDLVSSALNAMHQPAKGNRTTYTVTPDGRMQWQEKNNEGVLVNPGGVFNPRDVSSAIRAEQDKRTEKFIQTDGAGKLKKGPDGSSVRYNGDNTVGIGTNVMLMWRDDLVKDEGIRNKPYPDGSGGRTSVGVGINSSNPRFYPKAGPDGTVSDADISRSFLGASNEAMKQANEYMQSLPEDRRNTYATRLFGTLTYQGGSIDKPVLKALTTGTREEALAALKGSRQYRMSNDSRKQYYETMFNGIMPRNNF